MVISRLPSQVNGSFQSMTWGTCPKCGAVYNVAAGSGLAARTHCTLKSCGVALVEYTWPAQKPLVKVEAKLVPEVDSDDWWNS